MPTITNYHWSSVFDCVMHETDVSGATNVTYTHEPEQFGPLLSENRGGTEYYHHYDALGSTAFLTDDTGFVTDTFQNDAWGNSISRTGTTATPFQWGGRWGYQFDAPKDGYYIRARSYEPTSARWLSVDPTIHGSYTYCNNGPIAVVDLSGQAPQVPAVPTGGLFIPPDIVLTEQEVQRCKATLVAAIAAGGTLFNYPCASALLTQFIYGGNDPCPGACSTALSQANMDFVPAQLFNRRPPLKDIFNIPCSSATQLRDVSAWGSNSFVGNSDLFYALHSFNWTATVDVNISCGNPLPPSQPCCCKCDATWGGTVRVTDRFDFCSSIPPAGGLGRSLAICGCVFEKKGWGKPFNVSCPITKTGNLATGIINCQG